MRRHGHECRSPDLTEGDGGLDVLGVKRILDSHLIRLVCLNDLLEARSDFVDFMMEEFLARRSDRAGAENRVGVIRVFNDAESCRLNTGIDSKDPHQIYL